MTLNYVLIGKRIKNVRLAKGLSQSALAEVSGVSNQTICYIETGLKCPSLETLVALANSLSVTADELLGENLLICLPVWWIQNVPVTYTAGALTLLFTIWSGANYFRVMWKYLDPEK